MTTNQPHSGSTTGTTAFVGQPHSRVRRRVHTFPGELASTKAYVDGARVAVAILLSIVGFGSAMGQSSDQDMWMRGNTQAARERAASEIRQARSDGTIKRWSPALVEIQLKPRRMSPAGHARAPAAGLEAR